MLLPSLRHFVFPKPGHPEKVWPSVALAPVLPPLLLLLRERRRRGGLCRPPGSPFAASREQSCCSFSHFGKDFFFFNFLIAVSSHTYRHEWAGLGLGVGSAVLWGCAPVGRTSAGTHGRGWWVPTLAVCRAAQLEGGRAGGLQLRRAMYTGPVAFKHLLTKAQYFWIFFTL